MKVLESDQQKKMFGLDKYIINFINLYESNKLPNKILLTGQKGIGKSTLAYHLINYILSKNEEYKYDIDNFSINPKNQSFKTILNKSNPNLTIVDIDKEKKNIDINQIRNVISLLHKSSLNEKPRFILIKNIEFLNLNSINALLKVLEETSVNVYFILLNNNKKILPTLLSRCIEFKIFLSNQESMDIIEKLLGKSLNHHLNKDLINYYSTPGNIISLLKFAETNKYDLVNMNLKDFLKIIIKNLHYKKDSQIKFSIYELIETFFNKINSDFSDDVFKKYSYFLKRIANTKKFNLDEESLFMEFEEELLNG